MNEPYRVLLECIAVSLALQRSADVGIKIGFPSIYVVRCLLQLIIALGMASLILFFGGGACPQHVEIPRLGIGPMPQQ